MEKILVFLLLIIIPGFVYAELSEPYVAIVNNKSGAYLYAYNTETDNYLVTDYKLEYGTKVIVVDETTNYATLVNYVDVILLSDIEKTNESYEEYEKELAKVKDSVPLSIKEKQEKSNKNILKTVILCIISCILVIFIIICVNKRKGVKKND